MDFPLAWVNKYRKRLLIGQPFFCYWTFIWVFPFASSGSEEMSVFDNEPVFQWKLLLCLVCKCVKSHLLEHGYEAIAAGGGEVLLQADSINKIEFSLADFFRRMLREHFNQ